MILFAGLMPVNNAMFHANVTQMNSATFGSMRIGSSRQSVDFSWIFAREKQMWVRICCSSELHAAKLLAYLFWRASGGGGRGQAAASKTNKQHECKNLFEFYSSSKTSPASVIVHAGSAQLTPI